MLQMHFSCPENDGQQVHRSSANLHYVSLRYRLEQPIYLSVPRKEMREDSFGRGGGGGGGGGEEEEEEEEETKESEVGKEQTR
jgi:hypothetical protein